MKVLVKFALVATVASHVSHAYSNSTVICENPKLCQAVLCVANASQAQQRCTEKCGSKARVTGISTPSTCLVAGQTPSPSPYYPPYAQPVTEQEVTWCASPPANAQEVYSLKQGSEGKAGPKFVTSSCVELEPDKKVTTVYCRMSDKRGDRFCSGNPDDPKNCGDYWGYVTLQSPRITWAQKKWLACVHYYNDSNDRDRSFLIWAK